MVRRTLSVVVLAVASFALVPHLASAQSTSSDATRRGDVAVGYGFMYDSGRALPLGLLYSEAWRVHPKFDLIGDVGFQHGSVPISSLDRVGINFTGLMGGIRASGQSDFGPATTTVFQLKLGLIRRSTPAYSSGGGPIDREVPSSVDTAFGIEPSTGMEIGLHKRVALRPQIGVLFAHRGDGSWSSNLNFAVSAVFLKAPKAK